MSLWKKLFGGSAGQVPETAEEVEHEGYTIAATPIPEGSQFRLAATITREVDGSVRVHRLIRADLFGSAQDASDAAVRKAKLVIREQGSAMFDDRRG